ncbi:MAG: hypothetical protein AAF772_17895, partial [Acidobacteriota bacterium]
ARAPGARHDVAGTRAALAEARAATRLLTIACSAQWLVLLIVAPPALRFLGGARAWPWLIGLALALHLLAAFALWRAHRRLRARSIAIVTVDDVVAALLFPPALWALPRRLTTAAVGDAFSSLAVRAALMPRRPPVGALRRQYAAARDGGAADEASALRALAAAVDVAPETLDRPPPRRDLTASSWCPACAGDFRAGIDRCAPCDCALWPYPARAASVDENRSGGALRIDPS